MTKIMPTPTPQYQPPKPRELIIRKKILANIWMINFFLLVLIGLSSQLPIIGCVGAILLVTTLSVLSLNKPKEIFFVLFGIKFVYDGLWFVQLPGLGKIDALYLYIVPIICLFLFGPKITNKKIKKFLWFFVIYWIWIVLAIIFNGQTTNVTMLVKHAGPIVGLLLGAQYLKTKDDFNFLVLLVFISSVIPAVTLLAQVILAKNGIYILYGKFDVIRGFRYSGFYYDPGTMGLINIIAFLSGFYLLFAGIMTLQAKRLIYLVIFLNFICALIGQTRSALGVLAVIILFYCLRDIKKAAIILAPIAAILFVFRPDVSSVIFRSSLDVWPRDVSWGNLLEAESNRSLLTGRVGLWQDIWSRFCDGSAVQQLFGFGEFSNAHSSYFYLLLLVGYLGLSFYIGIHLFMFGSLFKQKYSYVNLAGLVGICSLLAIGLSLNVTVYTTYQWMLYMIIAGAMGVSTAVARTQS